MAICKEINLETGITLPTAYIKVTSVIFEYLRGILKVEIKVLIFKDQTAYNDNKLDIVEIFYKPNQTDIDLFFSEETLVGQNITPISQAYMWLKTQDWYLGAIDI